MRTPGAATIAITGASGHLGGMIARALEARGQSVLALGRSTAPRFDLREAAAAGAWGARDAVTSALGGTKILVHAGWDLSLTPLAERRRVNVEGSRALLEAAARAGVERAVFFSSTVARDDSRSQYGMAKREVERIAAGLFPRCLCLRIGLVLRKPGTRQNVPGPLGRALQFLPVVPWIGSGDELVYVIPDDEFGRAATDAILGNETGLAYVMNPRPLPVPELLARVLGDPAGTKRRVVEIPRIMSRAAWGLLRLDPQKLDSLADLRRIDIESGARVIT